MRSSSFTSEPAAKPCVSSFLRLSILFYKIYFCLWRWTEKVTRLKCSYFISKLETMVFSCPHLLLFRDCTNLLHPRWRLARPVKGARCQRLQLAKRASFMASGGTESSLQCMWVWAGRLPTESSWYGPSPCRALKEAQTMISLNVGMGSQIFEPPVLQGASDKCFIPAGCSWCCTRVFACAQCIIVLGVKLR